MVKNPKLLHNNNTLYCHSLKYFMKAFCPPKNFIMTYFCFTELNDLLVINMADVLSSTLMRIKTVKAVCVLYSFSCCFFSQLKQMFLLHMACFISSQLTHLEEPCSCMICINEKHAACNLMTKCLWENWEGNWQLLLITDFWVWVVVLILCFFQKGSCCVFCFFSEQLYSTSVIKQWELPVDLKAENHSSFWMVVSLRVVFWE